MKLSKVESPKLASHIPGTAHLITQFDILNCITPPIKKHRQRDVEIVRTNLDRLASYQAMALAAIWSMGLDCPFRNCPSTAGQMDGLRRVKGVVSQAFRRGQCPGCIGSGMANEMDKR
ncbi:hypothetical protein AVEN_242598-1 [Araneus ventricosus]|uniref:Uncharacterized protein n=1 Tax=Araneus ventricosus TaxID=182803 RepID=A0A4Y2EPJ8_ARAVE|nr:hypothetical protein AVEN_242598-1 [Araneus ventricosus]